MAKQTDVRKRTRSQSQNRKRRKPKTGGSAPEKIRLDSELLEVIAKEAEFLGLTKDEYCKLVFTSAQVLRETTIQQPLANTNVLKSVIDSPLLLSLVKSFATNFLSSSLQDLFTSLQNPSTQPETPQPRPVSPYPPTSYWNGF